MKPTSIIFLGISVILIIAGLSVVGISGQFAADEGIVLSTQPDEQGNYVVRHDYDASKIGKIEIDVGNANINIIGGAEKPYIELVNFAEGMYGFLNSEPNITITGGTEFFSVSGISSFITNFKGLRGFVNYYATLNLEKTINIYVSDGNPIKVIKCTVKDGTVNASDCIKPIDYEINVENGDFNAKGIESSSTVSLWVKNGNVVMEKSNIAKLDVDITRGNFTAAAKFGKVDADIDEGDFIFNNYNSINAVNYKLYCNVGKIIIDEVEYGGYSAKGDIPTENIVDVNVGVGNITIVSNFTDNE